jgi:A/G-specific adenine glycosylase
MLQQTQAARVVPAFRSFLRRFPTVQALAAAPRSAVLIAWGALGYPRRAVALSEAARTILNDHDGTLPSDVEELQRLPGIGPYTAAAVASLGYRAPVPALDTNVRRVVGRVIVGRDDAPPTEVRDAAERWLDRRDPGAWNQALMDVGRVHCGTKPRCDGCPLSRVCRFRRSGAAPAPPRRRQPRYEGSTRQLRGAILRELRSSSVASIRSLVLASGRDAADITRAVSAMKEEGLVDADGAALRGRRLGVIRLAE